MTLYGKQRAVESLTAMYNSGRLSHAVILTGEEGIGKKTLARWLCALLLCEGGEKRPCMRCKPCKKVLSCNHPDVVYIEHYGKRGGYEARRLQELTLQAYILPNDGEQKLYLFDDCDNISVQCQNLLLKLIEEPPAHCRFIFTARSAAIFLPTVRSRCTVIEVDASSEAQCLAALAAYGVGGESAQAALQAYGGNIGRCLAAARDPGGLAAAQSARALARAIYERDEYAALLALEGLQKDKPALMSALQITAELVRDGVVRGLGGKSLISGDQTLVAELCKRLTAARAGEILAALGDCAKQIEQNANPALAIACAAGRMV